MDPCLIKMMNISELDRRQKEWIGCPIDPH